MMSAQPSIPLLLLEAATDGKDSSVDGTPSETLSMVNGLGYPMVVSLPSLDDRVVYGRHDTKIRG